MNIKKYLNTIHSIKKSSNLESSQGNPLIITNYILGTEAFRNDENEVYGIYNLTKPSKEQYFIESREILNVDDVDSRRKYILDKFKHDSLSSLDRDSDISFQGNSLNYFINGMSSELKYWIDYDYYPVGGVIMIHTHQDLVDQIHESKESELQELNNILK